jgi:MFS family permease
MLDRRTRIALVAMSLAVFVIANDITSLSVALPQIERTFHVDVETVQWVMNAYTLVFGVWIVTAGGSATCSAGAGPSSPGSPSSPCSRHLAAVAWSCGVLIGARAAMAVGAALIWPSVVGLIFSLVPPERAGLAGALLLGVSGIGNALGPMIGGVLTDQPSWRWILVLNLPIAAAAVTLVRLYVPSDASIEGRQRLDWTGVGTLSVGLVSRP